MALVSQSPTDRVKAPVPETPRDRVLSDSELALILRAADIVGHPFGPYFKILILTGTRREEVAGMRWSELDPDLTIWTIPRERVKNGIEHTIPLAPWARSIVGTLPRIAGSGGFAFTVNGRNSISGYSKAKRELDAEISSLNGGAPIAPWRIHDLRRTFATGLARLGVQLPVVEKLLNHTSGSFAGVAGVYQRHDFADEKRHALERWAAHVADLVSGHRSPNVVRLETRVESSVDVFRRGDEARGLGKDASWQNIAGYTTCPESEAKSEPNSPFIWNSTRRFRWRQGL